MGDTTARLIITGLLSVLLLIILISFASRLMHPTAQQRAVLEHMLISELPAGRNAFDLMWLLPFDVPAEDMAAVIEADRQALEAADDGSELDWRYSTAELAYPDLTPPETDMEMFCRDDAAGCLERIRTDVAAYRDLVERNRRLIERAAQLTDFDLYAYRMPPSLYARMPRMMLGNLAMTRHALWFVEGRHQPALAQVCRDIDGWHRLAAHSDSFIVSMAGVRFSSELNGDLLMQMLAELPTEVPLPAQCDALREAPAADELWLCEQARGEMRMLYAGLAEIDELTAEETPAWDWLSPLFLDRTATSAMTAENFSHYCSPDAMERVELDLAPPPAAEQQRLLRFECLGNWMGCILQEIGEPSYKFYQERLLDHGLRLKLIATVMWLRDQHPDPADLEQRIEQRPAALHSPERDIFIDRERGVLGIPLYGASDAAEWVVPIAAALPPAAD
jgi:hypothetical protein